MELNFGIFCDDKREDVRDDLHRGRRRVDVRVPHHELFEDVVLDGPGELLERHALLLGSDDVEREDRQHRAVHRHRHAHLVERDPVEEDVHVEDRVDGHAGHAHVADDARVIAVVAPVRRQVEGDRQAHLSGGEVAPIEGVRVLRRGEAGVLAHRPGLAHVHGRVRAAEKRREARQGAEVRHALQIVCAVERAMRDALGGIPGRARVRRRGLRGPHGVEVDRGEVGQLHESTSRMASSEAATSDPTKTKSSTPASRSAPSSAPGRPASSTRRLPPALSARARFAASSA